MVWKSILEGCFCSMWLSREFMGLFLWRALEKNVSTSMHVSDWSGCPEIERSPEMMSGAWVFKGTRIPVVTLFENLKGGATPDEIVEWFPGVTKSQLEAVLEHEAVRFA
jgi:uncharacterized protein (DUF433 family)